MFEEAFGRTNLLSIKNPPSIAWRVFCFLFSDQDRNDGSREYLPGEQGLSDQTQSDVGGLTKEVVLPRSNLLVLEGLVEREGIEEDK